MLSSLIMTEKIYVVQHLFSTPLFTWENCELDLESLEKKCIEHKNLIPKNLSNAGGKQYHQFQDKEFFSFIQKNLPTVKDKPIKSFDIICWVNINGNGSHNVRHHHDPYSGTFLSGVFYIKTPKNSGDIVFYDPRPHIGSAHDTRYFSQLDHCNTYCVKPSPNMMLMFPAWLEHSVETNNSNETRISLSFNIADIDY